MTEKNPSTKQLKGKFNWKRLLAYLFASGLLGVAAISLYISFSIIPALPDVETLKNVQYQIPMSIYSRDGKLMAQYGEKKRTPVTYDQIPPRQIQAFLAAEDNRFFDHHGVDYLGLMRAASQLILTGEKRQGGSTITMQVARNFFLTRKKTYTRKIREIFLSFKIENELSKQDILALYLNKIYLGHRAYGIAAAANVYYGKTLSELTLAQQAMIAGLPKAPSSYNPLSNPQRALTRRNYILNRMLSIGYISPEEHQIALAEPLSAEPHNVSIELEAPYVAELVRHEMVNRYGEDVYTNGLQVYTSIDSDLQTVANRALRKGLHDYDRRHGYRGILGHVDLVTEPGIKPLIETSLDEYSTVGETRPALVLEVLDDHIVIALSADEQNVITWENMKWARPYINEARLGSSPKTPSDVLAPGDIIRVRTADGTEDLELAQVPQVSGAMAAIDPFDGALKAMIGGYDYFDSKFNRAYQAKRQPGSGFKPFLYLAALEKGYTPATLINDAPVVFDDAGLEAQWRPENYSGKFFGPTRLREALTHSRNLVSIRILRDIGTDYVIESSKRFLFNPDQLPRNLSLALGSGSASPFQMASGYAILANGGYQIQPYFVDRILDRDRETLYEARPLFACDQCPEAIETWTERQQTFETPAEPISPEHSDAEPESEPMLPREPQAPLFAPRVVSPQVHYQITSLLQNVIKHGTGRRAMSLGRTDLAGKTGTTNEQRDAWFNGFHPSIAATAWVGFDDSRPLGSREVGGRAALPIWIDFMASALRGVPNQSLVQPPNMVTVLIDPETGQRASANTPGAIFEVFREQYAPKNRGNSQGQSDDLPGKKDTRTLQQLF